GTAVGLAKPLEYMRKKFRTDPLAGVSYLEICVTFSLKRAYSHVPAGGREFNGVRYDVPDNLLHAVRIGGNQRRFVSKVDFDLDSFGFGCRPDHVDSRFNNRH